MTAQTIEADWTWTDGRFQSGMQVAVDDAGRIAAVGPSDRTPTLRLTGYALLPGMVSAHSHAFQRGLRGRGERFPAGAGSFWTWREAMYELVQSLGAATFVRLSAQAFREMRAAGITAVGEFHYLHHAPGAADFAFDELVLDAAREAGIRITLLNAYYRTGGIRKPLGPAQRRFAAASPEAYWQQMDRLGARRDGSTQTLGAAVHSVRAASADEIGAIHREALRRGLAFHIHLEEQRQEIEECRAAYGQTPMALLCEALDTVENVTAVHCTHTQPGEMDEFLEAGGRVCLCPLTEGNLGDGVPDVARLRREPERISLGTDSNARIAMLEEMRWLEYGQRLKSETRGVFSNATGDVAQTLFRAATVNGARALGLPAGAIEPGRWADFFSVHLGHPTLAGADEDTLLDALVFGAGNEAIAATCVGGEWRETAVRSET